MLSRIGYVAIAGVAGGAIALALTSAFTQAEVQTKPGAGTPATWVCAAGFVKSGPNDNYACARPFNTVCGPNLAASTPTVEKIAPGNNRYRVVYTCGRVAVPR